MNEKKKNILLYICIVVLIIASIVTGFILGINMRNTPDENGVVGAKNNISMTKEELNKYLVTFVENIDISYDKVSNIDSRSLFWFATRVYILNNKDLKPNDDNLYTIPRSKLANIIDKYFGIKDFKYEPMDTDNDLKYDSEKDIYTSELNWGFMVYGYGPEYNITLTNMIDGDDVKLATLKLVYDELEYKIDFTCTLDKEYHIVAFKIDK